MTTPPRADQTFRGSQALTSTGAPPGLLGVKSASQINANLAGSPYTLFTFTAPGRLWAVSLNYELIAQAAYGAGTLSSGYARVETGSGITLDVLSLSVNQPNQIPALHADLNLGGIPVQTTDTIILDINAAVGIVNAFQRASATVLYSIP